MGLLGVPAGLVGCAEQLREGRRAGLWESWLQTPGWEQGVGELWCECSCLALTPGLSPGAPTGGTGCPRPLGLQSWAHDPQQRSSGLWASVALSLRGAARTYLPGKWKVFELR